MAKLPRMAGITLELAKLRLAEYLAAETKVLTGQRYTIDGRTLERADLAEIRAGIEAWNSRVILLSSRAAGRSRARSMVPGW